MTKTGFFLDQQDNRRAIQHIVKALMYWAFCYTGSFDPVLHIMVPGLYWDWIFLKMPLTCAIKMLL
ncbi:MAG: hypothetical protein IPO42_11240 [Chitinophagaceae bacterium]|nr:hypothetical protein [Chitinophagaceae bacterium]